MNRSPLALRWVALGALVAVIASLAVTIASPAVADAQDRTVASLSLHVSEPSAEQPFRTAALALEPGMSGLAALGATVSFSTADVKVTSCAVSEVGACNVRDGQVLISVFNLGRLRANEQLLTFNFEPTTTAASSTNFSVVSTAALNNRGVRLSALDGDTVEVQIAPATSVALGSLTGTVVAADTATALFDIDICATSDATGAETCTTTTGLGNWRIDELEAGSYGVTAADRTDVYETSFASGVVVEDEIASVTEIAMLYFTPASAPADAAAATDEEPIKDLAGDSTSEDTTDSETAPPAVSAPQEPIVIHYGASIAGRVTGLETEAPIPAAQVCATQPLVLHQSCATTDANGMFFLPGLSTGNYWVEVVDSLGQFEQTRPKLVGLVGDDVARTGVKVTLATVAD